MRAYRAQSLAEYAMLVALIVAALAGVNIYLKRGLQAKYKTLVDAATIAKNSAGINVGTSQYEPYYAQSTQTTDQKQATTYDHQLGGAVTRGISSTVTVTGLTETTGLDTGADDAWR